jgi:hypothetical protein
MPINAQLRTLCGCTKYLTLPETIALPFYDVPLLPEPSHIFSAFSVAAATPIRRRFEYRGKVQMFGQEFQSYVEVAPK